MLVNLAQIGAKLGQLCCTQRLAQLRKKGEGRATFTPREQDQRRLHDLVFKDGGIAPVNRRSGKGRVQRATHLFRRQQTVKARLMCRTGAIGIRSQIGIAQRDVGAADPVMHPPQGNRTAGGAQCLLKMAQRLRWITKIGQRNIARQPLEIGVGFAIGQEMTRGQLIGLLGAALAHFPARQHAPPTRPAKRLTQSRSRG